MLQEYYNQKLVSMVDDFVIFSLDLYNVGMRGAWEDSYNIVSFSSFVDFAQTKIKDFLVLQFKNDFALEGKVVQEAKYALVAWVDEIFINSKWLGSKAWQASPLEVKIFDTREAGEKVFENIDELVNKNDSQRSDLLHVYLTILGLGFKGKFRASVIGQEAEIDEQLAFYTKLVYRGIYGADSKLSAQDSKIMPQAYEYTPDLGKAIKLISYKPWYFAIGGMFLAMVLLSEGIWFYNTGSIRKTVSEINTERKD